MKTIILNEKTLSLPVVNNATGDLVGSSFIPVFHRDSLKLSYLAVYADSEGVLSGEKQKRLIRFEHVCYINNAHAVAVQLSNRMDSPDMLSPERYTELIGKDAYSENGRFLGVMGAVELDLETGNLLHFITNLDRTERMFTKYDFCHSSDKIVLRDISEYTNVDKDPNVDSYGLMSSSNFGDRQWTSLPMESRQLIKDYSSLEWVSKINRIEQLLLELLQMSPEEFEEQSKILYNTSAFQQPDQQHPRTDDSSESPEGADHAETEEPEIDIFIDPQEAAQVRDDGRVDLYDYEVLYFRQFDEEVTERDFAEFQPDDISLSIEKPEPKRTSGTVHQTAFVTDEVAAEEPCEKPVQTQPAVKREKKKTKYKYARTTKEAAAVKSGSPRNPAARSFWNTALTQAAAMGLFLGAYAVLSYFHIL